MASLKELKRAGKFKKLGRAISALKPYTSDRDYYTGRESEFELKRYDALSRDDIVESIGVAFCPWPQARCEIPLGPRFNTPQWDRMVKTK